MENLQIKHISNPSGFTEFTEIAQRFCDFIESGLTFSSPDYLDELREILITLYGKAMDLPWVDLKTVEDFHAGMSKSYFEKILKSIADNLQDKRYYWDVSNTSTKSGNTKVVSADLVDNIGDIFKYLKYSLNILNSEKPNCHEVALWQFKFDFEYQWSAHCINAIRAIHFK